MPSEKKKPEYEERKAIVTEFEGVKFSVITHEVEKSTEGEGTVDAIKMAIGLKGKRDVKNTVVASVVYDPRLPTNGPVTQEIWGEYIKNLVLKEGRIKNYIANTVTTVSGVTTNSTDVELRASFDVATTPPPYLWAERRTCPKCGEEVLYTSKTQYCESCGNKL